jgi:uncharacterized protein YbbC (DUF1343 family)
MTVGELAGMFNSERAIGAKLTVVPMDGWVRGDWYDSTGMLWINPSPNLRSLTEATLYPGIGMIEGTNLSVGRGTDTPFELLGAPWIGPAVLAEQLNAREISGVRFIPVSFTPNTSAYAGRKCGGVNIVVTDRDALDAPELGLEIASALHHLYPGEFNLTQLDGLMRNKATLDALSAEEDPRRIAEDWQDDLEIFKTLRAKYLLLRPYRNSARQNTSPQLRRFARRRHSPHPELQPAVSVHVRVAGAISPAARRSKLPGVR